MLVFSFKGISLVIFLKISIISSILFYFSRNVVSLTARNMSILLQITFGGTNYSAGCVLNVVRLIDLSILLNGHI